MATYDYSALAATALRLLTKFGQTVTLRVYGEPVYDPATATATPVVTDYSRVGAVFDYTDKNQGSMLQNGTMAQADDRQLFLDAGTVAPTVSDRILLADTSEWTIANVKVVNPSGTAVVYECRIRK